MVGLGEERDELVAVFDDLRRVGVSILTIGQYLRPSADHAPMTRYYHPDEFADLKVMPWPAASLTSSPARSCGRPITRTNRPTPSRPPGPSPALSAGNGDIASSFPFGCS